MLVGQITSTSNPRVKDALRLRQGQHRRRDGRFLIDGCRELSLAVRAGIQIVELFVHRDAEEQDALAREVLAELARQPCSVWRVANDVFARIAYGDREHGVVAVAVTPEKPLASLTLSENPLIVVLEDVEKPGNVGAVLRTADGVGASGVILAAQGAEIFNPNTIRASLGTVFTVPVCTAEPAEALAWLRANQLEMLAARVDTGALYHEVRYPTRAALILGSEANGLSDVWNSDDVQSVRLPMQGQADSLNVSVTAAVLMYEAWRQRESVHTS